MESDYWHANGTRPAREDYTANLFEASTLGNLANMLRQVATVAPDAHDILESLLSWLGCVQNLMHDGHMVRETSRGRPYQAIFILQSMLLARNLCDRSALKQSVIRAMRVAFPAAIAEPFVWRAGSLELPSPASLSRFNLVLDVAYMHWWRCDVFPKLLDPNDSAVGISKEAAPMYLLCDSSPPGVSRLVLL